MNKYEIRTKLKKDAIVAAAMELFREKGYTGVSINEIAARSGVSSVSIYNYFGSKEGLVKECARILMRETTETVHEVLREDAGFKDKLMRVVALCGEQPHRLLEQNFSREALHDQVLLELYRESVGEIRRDLLEAFIECGKEEGAIDASVSTSTILDFLNAAAGVQAGWETAEAYQSRTAELYKLILYGLIGR
ncbi:MAG: TetR family transcriptional regulator [Paenibacillus sp.]|jgi:AcrR family transcriptional regulator|nr:TetR family transcriptional regulator [Paenibacillus sp.]